MHPKIGFFLICLALLAAGLWRSEIDARAPAQAAVDASPSDASVENSSGPESAALNSAAETAEQARMMRYLRNKYGARLDHPHTQIVALEKVITYLQSRSPEQWRSQLAEYLQVVFPAHAASMLQQADALASYNQWRDAARHRMRLMDAEQRRSLLWEKRLHYFGVRANAIWAEARQNEMLTERLHALHAGQSFAANQQSFLAAINEVYGEKAEQVIRARQQEFSNRFLSAEVVQAQLRTMSPASRQDALAAFRRELGMDQSDIAHWQQLDLARSERWQIGKQYMQKREQLVTELQGEPLSKALLALRQRMFGQEADTVRLEESKGYFRFAREPMIGRH